MKSQSPPRRICELQEEADKCARELAEARTRFVSMSKKLQEEIVVLEERLRAIYAQFQNALDSELVELDNKLVAIDKDREAFEMSMQRVALHSDVERSDVERIDVDGEHVQETHVNLNVGGRIFSLRPQVGAGHPCSFFGALFSGRWKSRQGAEAIFIDRSFRMFDHIADFLRDGEIHAELSPTEVDLLIREAEFYRLDALVESLRMETSPKTALRIDASDNWVWRSSEDVEIQNGGITALCKSDFGTDFKCHVVGTLGWTSGIHEWSILFDSFNFKRFGVVVFDDEKVPEVKDKILDQSVSFWIGNSEVSGNIRRVSVKKCDFATSPHLVNVRLDLDKRNITFGHNNTFFDFPHVVDLPRNRTFYPYVAMGQRNSTATIIRK